MNTQTEVETQAEDSVEGVTQDRKTWATPKSTKLSVGELTASGSFSSDFESALYNAS